MLTGHTRYYLLFRLKLELHFSLIAAAVAYIMWRSVGQLKKNGVFQSRLHKQLTSVPDDINNTLDPHRPKGHWRVDCQGASKGLFLGLLSLVAGIIVLIIFFVMKVSRLLFSKHIRYFNENVKCRMIFFRTMLNSDRICFGCALELK